MKKLGIEHRKSRYAYLFLLPWTVGVIVFFVVPMFKSLWYAFCKVKLECGGFVSEFIGTENFRYALKDDPNYVDNLISSFNSFVISLPLIVSLSLILAIVLNRKFHGRLFFRALYFMPVIIASGVVMNFLNGDSLSLGSVASAGSAAYTTSTIDFIDILYKLNFPDKLTELIASYLDSIFGLIWNCGVPIVLFLSGLQTISPQLYEASMVEGANSWEEFWFITLPMMLNVILLVIVYVALDLFTSESNLVISQAYDLMKSKVIYDTSSAMHWFYFVMIALILGVFILILYKTLFKKWQQEVS
jgi:ABC-type sugar transport system permease subunit